MNSVEDKNNLEFPQLKSIFWKRLMFFYVIGPCLHKLQEGLHINFSYYTNSNLCNSTPQIKNPFPTYLGCLYNRSLHQFLLKLLKFSPEGRLLGLHFYTEMP